jgi:type IV pilus assembly protein PilQ
MNKPKLSLANPFFAFFLLTALFALTAVATIAANRFLGRKYESQPTDAELSQARADAIAAIPQLPKDTEEKLSAALHPELTPITTAFVDPLIDRLGIDRGPQANAPRLTSLPLATSPLMPTTPDKVVRLIQWQQAARNAYAVGLPAPSITTAYLISELSPAGRITTSGAQAAWLYIESEKRQIAANVGAKFYDGILAGIDRQGVVFRTSTGQTKLIQWDRQEEFSARPTTPPPSTERPPQPIQAKPASETTPADNFTPAALARPNPVGRRDDYSDLQIAVRDRYLQNTNPNATNVIIENESPSDQVITPNRTTSAPILTTIPNPFSANTERPNQLDYAHAPQTRARATLNFRTATAAAVFNLDDPTSFSEKSTNATQSSILPLAQTNEVPAPTPTPSPAQTPDIGKEAAGPINAPITAKAQPEPRKTLCDSTYHGENLSITNESNRPLSLLTLVNRLNEAYSANIVLDYDVQETPVRLTITNAPWTSILRTLLDLNDLDMVCLDGGIVQIAKRTKIASIGDLRRRSAPIVREVFKLKYLQQTAGARANLAGQTQTTNGATIQSLEDAIRDILKAGGDPRGEARRVPGRNQLLVAATAEQMQDIRDLIARVDRPGYQVKISALVYTANENRLRDIGSQLAIVVGNSSGTNLGGGTTLPNSNTGSGNGGDNQQPSGLNPGGIPGLASGMRVPSNGLSAANPLATFGVTSVFGTAQFAYQLTLAQQKGVVNIQSRPFGIVADGDTFDLVAGTQIPVVTTTIAGGAPFQSGQVQFIEASRIARITPQVAEDETGKPNYVTLNIQLENNSVDTSLGTFNGVPGVNRQSLQTVLRLGNGETVVIGGLAADQVANSVSKVPGLGSIPLLGNLFKRRANQENRDRLYFAITVEVIPQNSAMPNFVAPADAITAPPPPPRAQKPSPFDKRQ